MYNEKVIEHFRHPHNFGEIEDPDGVGEVGNIVCGDLMKLYIKISENEKGEKIIKDIKFQTYGCAAALATSSIITDLVKGKTLNAAMEFSNKEIIDALGGLPQIKIHCSILAADALNEAIYDYFTKNKTEIPKIITLKHERITKMNELMKEKFQNQNE